jgi:hypothetical protein
MKKVRSIVSFSVLVGGLLAGGLFGAAPSSSAASTGTKSCVSSQITVSRGTAQGTAGTTYYALVFTNTGASVCTLFGVPVIQPVIGPSHRPLGPLARNESMGEMPALHTLAHGASVSVAFGVADTGNYTASTCGARRVRGVVVKLGAFVRPTYLSLPITVCTKLASTTTRLVSPGVTGN